MFNIDNIKKGFASLDDRPVIIWQGDGPKIGGVFRVVLTKKNSLIIEVQGNKNAMEEPNWSTTTDHKVDAEVLSRILFEAIKEINVRIP